MTSQKSQRGFTLVEIICVVVLLGLFGSIGIALMRDTATTGRTNVLDKNVIELNKLVMSLRASGAVFSSGTLAITSGTQTTSAAITLPPTATTASTQAFITALSSSNGIRSLGIVASLNRTITAASYTYTLDSDSVPIWTTAAGTNLAP